MAKTAAERMAELAEAINKLNDTDEQLVKVEQDRLKDFQKTKRQLEGFENLGKQLRESLLAPLQGIARMIPAPLRILGKMAVAPLAKPFLRGKLAGGAPAAGGGDGRDEPLRESTFKKFFGFRPTRRRNMFVWTEESAKAAKKESSTQEEKKEKHLFTRALPEAMGRDLSEQLDIGPLGKLYTSMHTLPLRMLGLAKKDDPKSLKDVWQSIEELHTAVSLPLQRIGERWLENIEQHLWHAENRLNEILQQLRLVTVNTDKIVFNTLDTIKTVDVQTALIDKVRQVLSLIKVNSDQIVFNTLSTAQAVQTLAFAGAKEGSIFVHDASVEEKLDKIQEQGKPKKVSAAKLKEEQLEKKKGGLMGTVIGAAKKGLGMKGTLIALAGLAAAMGLAKVIQWWKKEIGDRGFFMWLYDKTLGKFWGWIQGLWEGLLGGVKRWWAQHGPSGEGIMQWIYDNTLGALWNWIAGPEGILTGLLKPIKVWWAAHGPGEGVSVVKWIYDNTLGALWNWIAGPEGILKDPISGFGDWYEKTFPDGLVKWVWDHTYGGLFKWVNEKLKIIWPDWDIGAMVKAKFAEVVMAINSKWDWAVPDNLAKWAEGVMGQVAQADVARHDEWGGDYGGEFARWAKLYKAEQAVTGAGDQDPAPMLSVTEVTAAKAGVKGIYGHDPLTNVIYDTRVPTQVDPNIFSGDMDSAELGAAALKPSPIIILPADAVSSALITPVRDTIADQAQSYLNSITAASNVSNYVEVRGGDQVIYAVESGKNNIKQRQHSQRAPSRNQ